MARESSAHVAEAGLAVTMLSVALNNDGAMTWVELDPKCGGTIWFVANTNCVIVRLTARLAQMTYPKFNVQIVEE